MDFYDVIEERTSIRNFKNEDINEEKLDRIIKAAMMSPSWKNRTSYKFILVKDNEKKEELSKAIMNDTNEAANSIIEAPMAAVIVGNPTISGEIDKRDYYLVDSAIAMEHFILAATSEGYGTCWIASVDEDKIRKTLHIPEEYRVVAITPIGEIAENKPHNEKKDTKEYVFLDQWNKSYDEAKNLVLH